MTPTAFMTGSSASALPSEQINPVHKVALTLFFVELFIIYTRLFDQVAVGFHLPAIVLVLLVLTSVASGSLLRGFQTKTGHAILWFVVWVTLTLPFSIWKSGSIPGYEGILESLLLFAMASGLVALVRHSQQMMNALAYSSLIAAFLSYFFGVDDSGRLALIGGSYHDPNEYSMCLLMGIPFWWRIAAASRNKLVKIVAFGCTLPIFWTFAKTGSRGGSLGLLAVVLVLFIGAPLGKKVMIAAAIGLGLVAAIAFMPGYLKVRYLTYFSTNANTAGGDSENLGSDAASGQGRKDLVIKSVIVTLHNPIFGVGPGNFPVAVFEDAKAHGERFPWLVTHNSYTQISSETGIPGLICFVMIISYAFKSLRTVGKLTKSNGPHPRPDIESTAKYMSLSLTAVSVCIFFLSVGYSPLIYIFSGIAVGLERAVRLEMSRASVPAMENPSQPMFVSKFHRPVAVNAQPAVKRWDGRPLGRG